MTQELKRTPPNLTEPFPKKESETLEIERKHLEESLSTIKEILIREYAREVQKKMTSLEERLSRELSQSLSDTHRRFDSLESCLRKELQILREDEKKEQEERSISIEQISTELKMVSKNFEQKMTHINQLISTRVNDLREQILNESHSISAEILRKHQEIYEDIEKRSTILENRKPDRQFIAALLVKMASALQEEPLKEAKNNITEFKPKAIKKSD